MGTKKKAGQKTYIRTKERDATRPLAAGETCWRFRHKNTNSYTIVIAKTWFVANQKALTLLGAEPGTLVAEALEGLHAK